MRQRQYWQQLQLQQQQHPAIIELLCALEEQRAKLAEYPWEVEHEKGWPTPGTPGPADGLIKVVS